MKQLHFQFHGDAQTTAGSAVLSVCQQNYHLDLLDVLKDLCMFIVTLINVMHRLCLRVTLCTFQNAVMC